MIEIRRKKKFTTRRLDQIVRMLFFRHRSAEMDSLLHWIGVAVVLLIIALTRSALLKEAERAGWASLE
jgi:hypothetical protein